MKIYFYFFLKRQFIVFILFIPLIVAKVFLYFNLSRPIDWIGSGPPVLDPPCGFIVKNCFQIATPDWKSFMIYTLSGVALIVTIGFVSR